MPNLARRDRLVLQPQGDVFFLEALDAFRHQRLLKFLEQRLVARNQPRLDERRFGLHVRVGDFHAVVNAADRMADLQPDVPQRIQHAVNQLGQIRQRLVRRDLAVVQKHEVNVAVRIQLRAAVTADGHQRQRRKFLLRLRRQAAFRRLPQMPQQRVQHRRAAGADFAPARARAMPQFEPVRLDLEKTLVARQFLGGGAVRRQRQTRFGGGLNFFE